QLGADRLRHAQRQRDPGSRRDHVAPPAGGPGMTASTGQHTADRRLASVSLDLDNLWSYMKIRGDAEWESRPSYLDEVTPFMLEFLERLGIRITFFIVGADAAIRTNGPALRSLVDAGH